MSAIKRQRGIAYLTTLIALPVLGALIGGAIQLGLLFHAKLVLNYAVLHAARAGAHGNALAPKISDGLIQGLKPLYVSDQSYESLTTEAYVRAKQDVEINSCIKVLNPSQEAFVDFDVTLADPLRDNTIAYYELDNLPATPGVASGVSIQQAMNLQVYVLYGARAEVPLIGPLITAILLRLTKGSSVRQGMLARNRVPIEAHAFVRMSSNAKLSTIVAAKGTGKYSC